MKTIILGSAAAVLALAIAPAASAQQLPPAVIAVVDTDQILTQCTACVAANGQLQVQQQQAQARAQQLQAPLQTEGQAIQTALGALQGRPADAALQARARTWENQRDAANRELQGREETLRRNIGFVRQQILQRLAPVVQQVAQQRGASIALDANATLWASPALDITPAVLAGLNAALPSVNVNAPPPQQQQAPAPAAQQPAPPRPRTGGR
jgi:Skp family chaperone for outer membrane proteins